MTTQTICAWCHQPIGPTVTTKGTVPQGICEPCLKLHFPGIWRLMQAEKLQRTYLQTTPETTSRKE